MEDTSAAHGTVVEVTAEVEDDELGVLGVLVVDAGTVVEVVVVVDVEVVVVAAAAASATPFEYAAASVATSMMPVCGTPREACRLFTAATVAALYLPSIGPV